MKPPRRVPTQRVALRKPLHAWQELVAAPSNRDQAVYIVHGALRRYEHADLIVLGPEKVQVEEPADPRGVAVAPRR